MEVSDPDCLRKNFTLFKTCWILLRKSNTFYIMKFSIGGQVFFCKIFTFKVSVFFA